MTAPVSALRELLADQMVTMEFQPIVVLPQETVVGYEALGRGRHPQLSESPLELFRIAESIGAEAELSRLFRRKAVEIAREQEPLSMIFLNTHPIELERPGLLVSLEELRDLAPQLSLALEIHENARTRPAQIFELRALLRERKIALAYDNFGAGHTRLLELVEAPPDYPKFNSSLVRGLDLAFLHKRRFLHSFLSLTSDLMVKSVAVGIETVTEAAACAEVGFTHGQGFFFGPPMLTDKEKPLTSAGSWRRVGGGRF